MDITTAKRISIREILSRFGHEPAPGGVKKAGRELWYLSPLRTEVTPSFKVNLDANIWHDKGPNIGGNAFDLVKAMMPERSNSEVLSWFNREFEGKASPPPLLAIRPANDVPKGESVNIILSDEPLGNPKLLDYVTNERGIHPAIARRYLREVHYKNAETQKKYYALGFKNDLGGFELRNKYFKGSTSPKTITALSGTNTGRAYTFEGSMDFLTWLTMNMPRPIDGDVIVLNGTGHVEIAKEFMQSQGYTEIFSFYDNGKGGQAATACLQSAFPGIVKPQNSRYVDHDDLNEFWQDYLRSQKQQGRA